MIAWRKIKIGVSQTQPKLKTIDIIIYICNGICIGCNENYSNIQLTQSRI